MFYNLDGIITTEEHPNNFWVRSLAENFIFKENDKSFELEEACIELRNKFANKLFESLNKYYALLPSINPIFQFGGIDAEINISKAEFENLVNSIEEKELSNKILYFYDCCNLIETLQNSLVETKYLFGQFYKLLNENTFLINGELILKDDLQFASGPIVTNLTSVINHLFINMYSQLDFTTKIIYEFENLESNFLKYPNLKSSKILYGDSKKTKLKGAVNSIFDKSENTLKIITLRNEIVHNSSIDNLPKVYLVIKESQIVEKFVLIPDFIEGNLQKLKNRNRFFSSESKLNLLLPEILDEHNAKLLFTLNNIT